MCRSIKTLRRQDDLASAEEVHAAALQFVRKISGYRVPSRSNAAAFEDAVTEITAASRRLLFGLNANSAARPPASGRLDSKHDAT